MNKRRLLVFTILFAWSAVACAHEGHKEDKTDAELIAESVAAEHRGPDEHADAPSLSAEEVLQQRIEANRLQSADNLLGRLHPVAVHFPIALFLMALIAEVILMRRPAAGMETTVRLLTAGGAAGAVVSALLGWYAAGWRLSDRSETLGLHRWLGTAIALLGVAAWWTARDPRQNRWILRSLLTLLAAAVIFQGYLGGELSDGPNHLGLR
ncbi:hypothetical protein KTQ36_09950 [Sphingomicrobium sp. B8]|uniref:DUF2231 domain-containing protein n=2 Tax=Sphingomicrobium clamense TaxID=2851013 RepID=A0ABS6V966_9SPHN|nr:DUF2231 domain-containing protein [Sphingomicrobium sp. B8]MBW0145613.1 hypothetical protein [Sphingomicrobium sp. B8]